VKIYTRGGDTGQTSLFGGARVAKNDARIEAYGTVDELNSFIGVARASWTSSPLDHELAAIQSDLFDVGAQLASPGIARFSGVEKERIAALEHSIDTMEHDLEPLTSFILPAGSVPATHLHVARTVCRRAERLVVVLNDESHMTTIAYLNRLSDWLFVAARFANARNETKDVLWQG
jgi:cob(I)alamin adenosyltransferase